MPMYWCRREPTLEDSLSEPIIRAVMEADRVDRTGRGDAEGGRPGSSAASRRALAGTLAGGVPTPHNVISRQARTVLCPINGSG